MPTILGFAALFLLATDALNWDLSLLPGVSAKNLIIYCIAVILALRMVVGRHSVTDMGQMQGAFIVLIAYAIVTWLIAALVIGYEHYDLVASAIRLKSGLIDYYIFFLVFLFGAQTTEDAMKVIKGLLLGALFANVITILDAAGIVSLGFRIRDDGRTAGAIGESNQYAAFIVLFLPATDRRRGGGSRGLQRLFWFGAALVGAMTLVMTASRGGFVGLAMACAVGAYLYRHLISYSRIAGWVFGSLILLVLMVSFSPYGNLLAERIIGTTAPSTRARRRRGAATSGRPRWRRCSRIRSPSSPASAGTSMRRCRSSSRRTTTISICGSTSGWSACCAAAICCSRPSGARDAPACRRHRRCAGS